MQWVLRLVKFWQDFKSNFQTIWEGKVTHWHYVTCTYEHFVALLMSFVQLCSELPCTLRQVFQHFAPWQMRQVLNGSLKADGMKCGLWNRVVLAALLSFSYINMFLMFLIYADNVWTFLDSKAYSLWACGGQEGAGDFPRMSYHGSHAQQLLLSRWSSS
jgi:hypothetical protein